MKTLLKLTKTLTSPLTVVPLLGISIDVTLRLKNVKDEKIKEVDPAIKVQSFLETIRLDTQFSYLSRRLKCYNCILARS